jgi:hypothetical protein
MNANEFIGKLLDGGYEEFKDNLKNCTRSFQKRVRNDIGTKYFINAYYYEERFIGGTKISDSFEFQLQFEKLFKRKEMTINVHLFSLYEWNMREKRPEFHDLDIIEEFIEKLFFNNKFEYYEKLY